ncbi:MAG: hypothetical protein IT330_13375, partial [Anaerolineae bacterium]|nr:hypothetical protein [Anaerolineae bacterium]
RERQIDQLLHGADNAYWVVGTRRLGKTSLLRHLEYLALAAPEAAAAPTKGSKATDGGYVPLFWDLQGCRTLADLGHELAGAVEDAAERFEPLGVRAEGLEGKEVPTVLRSLSRAVKKAGKRVLLLVDEAEALVTVGRADPLTLDLLRKPMQSQTGLRTVIAATKALGALSDLSRESPNSPFLLGFALRTLERLRPAETEALICQAQSPQPVQVSLETMAAVQEDTNNHPYLLQLLCHRLWQDDNSLRPPQPDDLLPDPMLDAFFSMDVRLLSHGERAVLKAVMEVAGQDEAALEVATGLPPDAVRAFTYSLHGLGYLRLIYGRWAVGNQFLAAWLKQNPEQVATQPVSVVSDRATQELAEAGRGQEIKALKKQLRAWNSTLRKLELQRASFGLAVPVHILNEIDETRAEVERISQELKRLLEEQQVQKESVK